MGLKLLRRVAQVWRNKYTGPISVMLCAKSKAGAGN